MEKYWSFESWYSQFVTVAAAILSVALVGVSVCDYLIDRYQWKLAHGEIVRLPALAQMTTPQTTPVTIKLVTANALRLPPGPSDIGAVVARPTANVLASFAPPPRMTARGPAVLQQPLQLQPGVTTGTTRPPATMLWLSNSFHPGSAGLVDVVAAGDV